MVLTVDITLPRRSFDLRVGLSLGAETVALVGPSGAGKTSLLRAIAGLEPAARGRIGLAGETWLDTARSVHVSPERRRVGYLPQDYGLFPHLTVAGNVRFAARRERPDLLERLRIAHLADARPAELSGGERQRAALARALAREPQVLLLDEPFGALDPITREHVRDELAEILSGVPLPTLLVTHSFEDATHLADVVGVLDGGRVLQLGSASELERHPADATVAKLTGANVVHATATRTQDGSRLELAGGGELLSTAPAAGPVLVAIHPWAFELAAPQDGTLTDRVVSVRREGGTLRIKFTRLSARVPASGGDHAPFAEGSLAEGSLAGLRVSPEDVIVVPGAGDGGPGDVGGRRPEPITDR